MVRFLIIFFLYSCSSVEKNNLTFDSSFEGMDRFLLKRCLSNIGQDLEITELKVINLANNINSEGLEFNSKTSMSVDIKFQNEKIKIKSMQMSPTNYISSNMSLELEKQDRGLMIQDICDKIKKNIQQ
tara:strand:+ start:217 stop:600 length:384 start_codon:yes stop_codon:yes gene_type:complete